jgi:hypothetical protein
VLVADQEADSVGLRVGVKEALAALVGEGLALGLREAVGVGLALGIDTVASRRAPVATLRYAAPQVLAMPGIVMTLTYLHHRKNTTVSSALRHTVHILAVAF